MSRPWNIDTINICKVAVKGELDKIRQDSGRADTLRYVLGKAAEQDSDPNSIQSVYKYVYLMSALVQHLRYGGLSKQKIDNIVDNIENLLIACQIPLDGSSLSFLYGELYTVSSQIKREAGQLFSSAWDNAHTLQLPYAGSDENAGFPLLGAGIVQLRLGNAAYALRHFEKASQLGLSQQHYIRMELLRISTYRLLQEFERATEVLQRLLQEPLDGLTIQELEWEKLLLKSSKTRDKIILLNATARNGSHYQPGYILDTHFRVFCDESLNLIDRLPKMRYLKRLSELRLREKRFDVKAALVIEESYDRNIPLVFRIRNLGSLLASSAKMPSFEKELLFWAAAARWTFRIRKPYYATVALSEYTKRCLLFTGGKSHDVDRLCANLMGKKWLREYELQLCERKTFGSG